MMTSTAVVSVVAGLGLVAASLPAAQTKRAALLEAALVSSAFAVLVGPWPTAPRTPGYGLAALAAVLVLRLVSSVDPSVRTGAPRFSSGRHLLPLLAFAVAGLALFAFTGRASGFPRPFAAIVPFITAHLAYEPSRVSLRAAVYFGLLPMVALAFVHT